MRNSRKWSTRIGVSAVLVPFLVTAVPLPAVAGMISTERALAAAERSEQEAKIAKALEREDVRDQMVAMGVDPDQAKGRVAALSDAELAQLSARMDTLPAGAGVGEVILIVLLILIILELMGETNVFTKI